MTSHQTFNYTLITFIISSSIFYIFIYITGDTYLEKDINYNEDICFPIKNYWKVNNCLKYQEGLTNYTAKPRLCYVNNNCDISFILPLAYPSLLYLFYYTFFIILLLLLLLPPLLN